MSRTSLELDYATKRFSSLLFPPWQPHVSISGEKMRFILPGSSWKWKGQSICSLGVCSWGGMRYLQATGCSQGHCVPSPWGSTCSTPNSHAHHCSMYLQHLFANASMSLVKHAVSPSCGWMPAANILEILSVLVWEGLDKRCVCFWVLSGHFRLIRQLSRSEQQCLCNFIPTD